PRTRAHTLSLHDALPISGNDRRFVGQVALRLLSISHRDDALHEIGVALAEFGTGVGPLGRLNARHRCKVAALRLAENAELRAARSEEHTSELQSRFDLVC